MQDCIFCRRQCLAKKKTCSKKSTYVHQFVLAGVILFVFIIFSSVHFFSQSLLELRKKLVAFEFTSTFDRNYDAKSENNGNTTLLIRPTIEAKRVFQERIDIGEILPNCGLPQQCPDDSFAVHVYTGSGKDDGPRLCILGKYVIGTGLNGGGRGINAALIDPISLRVVSVKNFDTYSGGSTELETWILNEIVEGDIAIFFTFDEASKDLSNFAKRLLYELGSYRVQELHFRSQWLLVTQRGIVGFTPYEVLHAASHSHWAEPINIRLCVPYQLKGQAVSPDPVPSENIPREQFCEFATEYSYDDFCEASARREAIIAAQLTNRSLIGNPIFSMPWLVLTGEYPLYTFEGIVGQPGVNPSLVHVFYNPVHSKIPPLAFLFGFQPVNLPKNHTRSEGLEFGLKFLRKKYPDKKYTIVLEDDVLLSPDFLAYMAQVVLVMEKDTSLIGASSWNPYGFENVSSDVNMAYRVREFPGASFLLPMTVFVNYMEGKFNACCTAESFMGWPKILKEINDSHIIVPDVSRVLLPWTKSRSGEPKRITNIDQTAYINRPQDLTSERYFQMIASLVKDSNPIHMTIDDLEHCRIDDQLLTSKIMKEYSHKKFVIYFKEDRKSPIRKLKKLVFCFGISVNNKWKPRCLYKGLLRLTVNHNSVLLIEAKSPFYKSRPSSVQPL